MNHDKRVQFAVRDGLSDKHSQTKQCVLTCSYVTKVKRKTLSGMLGQMLICGELCYCVLHQHHHLN